MAITYTPIATQTLGSNQADVTFSSISGSYTDLILVMMTKVSSGVQNTLLQVNSDTGSNYSSTFLYGNGSSALSARGSNNPYGYANYGSAVFTSNFNLQIVQFMNYANTTTNKTFLARGNEAGSGTDAIVNLWRSTAAISTIKVYPSAQNWATGSTFTLYGIKAA
jgi:hypothetical protein